VNKVKILNINLENFRGIKKIDINFDGKDTDIYGANGTGKTTIANAVSWLLFNKAATGEKDFSPKTVGTHNLHHTAEARFQEDTGSFITLKKDFYESWKTKKGSAEKTLTGNKTDYWIDEVPVKESEYNRRIQSICGGTLEVAKMLTMYDYFPEVMSVDDRRKILFDVCGDLTDDDVIASTPELAELNRYLLVPGTIDKKYSPEEYKKIASEQRKKINHDLEMLPARIDEVTKSIPAELPNEITIKADIVTLNREIESINTAIREIKDTDTNSLAIQKEILQAKNDLEEKRSQFSAKTNEEYKKKYTLLGLAQDEQQKLKTEERKLTSNLSDLKDKITRLTASREALVKEFTDIQSKQWDAGQETCPTCGQSLPTEKVEAMREEFNLNKSRVKEDINRRGQLCSKEVINVMQSELAHIQRNLDTNKINYDMSTVTYEEISASIRTKPTFEDTLDYKEIQTRLQELMNKQNDTKDSLTSVIEVKNKEKSAILDKIQNKNVELSSIEIAKKAKERIKELTQEQRKSGSDLENIEQGLFLCDEFTRAKVRMVTNNINSKFSLVRFKLFDDQLNGGLKERCEAMVQNTVGEWIEYRSANTASQVNAGMDIISVLSRFYEIHLPVFIDRAESVTHIINPDGLQLIRLIVSPEHKTLTIEKE